MFIQCNIQCKQFLWMVFLPFSYHLIYFILAKLYSMDIDVHLLENLSSWFTAILVNWLVYLTKPLSQYNHVTNALIDKFPEESVPSLMLFACFRLKMGKCCSNCRKNFHEVNGIVKLFFIRFHNLWPLKWYCVCLNCLYIIIPLTSIWEVSVMEQAVFGIPWVYGF